MSHEHVYKISSRYLQKWLRYNIKHVKNRRFSRDFGTLPWFSEFCFFTDFDASKSVLGSFFAFFAKIWPKNMYRSSKSRHFFAGPFSPGDLTWPWPLLWSQSAVNDTYKCQRHYQCRFVGFVWAQHCNFARRCHQARNVEHFDFDLTCDVTRDPEVNTFFPSTVFSRAFKCRLNFYNRSSSFGDQRGARNSPPPQWGAL